jgi:hypothetical protein
MRVDLSAGEGTFYRERNNQKNLAGTLILQPWPWLSLLLYGRQGFTGLGAAPSHRLGGQIHLDFSDKIQGGVEILQAWGVEDHPLQQPLGGNLWAYLRPWGPILGFVRGDLVSEKMGDADATWGKVRVGGGVNLGPARLLAGWEYQAAGNAVAVASGAGASTDVNLLYLQLDVDLKWEKP